MTPEHEKLKSAIVHADVHIIATMRSKQDYVLETNDKGKQAPKKVGLAPVQREGMEYEFTVCFDVAMNHEAEASKDRTGLFGGKLFQVTEATGQTLKTWLMEGKSDILSTPTVAPLAPHPSPSPVIVKSQSAPAPGGRTATLKALLDQNHIGSWPPGSVQSYCVQAYEKSALSHLTESQWTELQGRVKTMTAAQAVALLSPGTASTQVQFPHESGLHA
jgi:hypothetical protein